MAMAWCAYIADQYFWRISIFKKVLEGWMIGTYAVLGAARIDVGFIAIGVTDKCVLFLRAGRVAKLGLARTQ